MGPTIDPFGLIAAAAVVLGGVVVRLRLARSGVTHGPRVRDLRPDLDVERPRDSREGRLRRRRGPGRSRRPTPRR